MTCPPPLIATERHRPRSSIRAADAYTADKLHSCSLAGWLGRDFVLAGTCGRSLYMSLPNNQRLPKTCRMAAIGVALMIAVTAVGQSPGGKDIPTLARETSPSVVRIVIRDQAGGELGSVSGFVIGSDGRVVTNYHVVHIPGTTQAEARFADGASYQVQGVLATDPDKDLAVLKLQATGKVFQAVHL